MKLPLFTAPDGANLHATARQPAGAAELRRVLLAAAQTQGFSLAAIAHTRPPETFARFEQWLAAGNAGEMDYLARAEDLASRSDLEQLMPGAKSVLVVGLPVGRATPPVAHQGRIATYAQGADYHHVVKQRLHRIGRSLDELAGRKVAWRACCDSAPVLERELAVRAGLGFYGKNTLFIAPGAGSHLLLGELVTDLDIGDEANQQSQRCGRCTSCIDRCPTGALTDGHLDARLCISYLTIEYGGVIPRELRAKMGTWVYGCDICQDVCPFNEGSRATERDAEMAPRTPLLAVDLPRLITIGSAQHRKFVRRTALRRAPREQLQRNACIAAGNVLRAEGEAQSGVVKAGDAPEITTELVETLVSALAHAVATAAPLVRGHAVWALGQLAEISVRAPESRAIATAKNALTGAAASETESWIRQELVLASTAIGGH